MPHVWSGGAVVVVVVMRGEGIKRGFVKAGWRQLRHANTTHREEVERAKHRASWRRKAAERLHLNSV